MFCGSSTYRFCLLAVDDLVADEAGAVDDEEDCDESASLKPKSQPMNPSIPPVPSAGTLLAWADLLVRRFQRQALIGEDESVPKWSRRRTSIGTHIRLPNESCGISPGLVGIDCLRCWSSAGAGIQYRSTG